MRYGRSLMPKRDVASSPRSPLRPAADSLAPWLAPSERERLLPSRPKPGRWTRQLSIALGAVVTLGAAGAVASVVSQRRATVVDLTQASPTPADAAVVPEAPSRPVRVIVPGPARVAEMATMPGVTLYELPMKRRVFLSTLADKGIPASQIYRVIKAFTGVKSFDRVGDKDIARIAYDRTKRTVRGFEFEVSPTEIYQARENAQGKLVGVRLDMQVAEAEVSGSFYIGADLVAAVRMSSLEPAIVKAIDRAIEHRTSLGSVGEGGTVRVVAQERTALGAFVDYTEIAALELSPADPSVAPQRFYTLKERGLKGLWDERGRQPDTNSWRSPVPGAPITSRFNPRRMHPVLKKIMPHHGTDFAADTGTPVYAAYRGVVESVGEQGPSGNLVTVRHANGVTTGYAHLSRFANLSVGQEVGTHQLVGYVGSTGRSTGPHLHFSAKRNGGYFDAETLLLDRERHLPAEMRSAFQLRKEELDRMLDAIPLPEPPPEPAAPLAEQATTPLPVALLPALEEVAEQPLPGVDLSAVAAVR